jgi:hypothetical protein
MYICVRKWTFLGTHPERKGRRVSEETISAVPTHTDVDAGAAEAVSLDLDDGDLLAIRRGPALHNRSALSHTRTRTRGGTYGGARATAAAAKDDVVVLFVLGSVDGRHGGRG